MLGIRLPMIDCLFWVHDSSRRVHLPGASVHKFFRAIPDTRLVSLLSSSDVALKFRSEAARIGEGAMHITRRADVGLFELLWRTIVPLLIVGIALGVLVSVFS